MDDPRLRVGVIHNKNGEKYIYVAEFIENVDVFHIAEHNNQWIVLKGGDHSASASIWIPEQAMELLKVLPNRPYNYKPFMQYLSRS